MWIFTTSGFISAVRNPNDRTIIVRSRDRQSLQQISQDFKTPVMSTPFSDYQYRVVLESEQFTNWVKNQAAAIDYPNFKSAVQTHRGKIFARALNKVWSTMHDIEDEFARSQNDNR
jgi:hypothetical protein